MSVSDEYLIRPSEESFWKIETSTKNGDLVISRVVPDEDGVPQVREGGLTKTAARVSQVGRRPFGGFGSISIHPCEGHCVLSLAASEGDTVLLIDLEGGTYDMVADRPLNFGRFGLEPRVKKYLDYLQSVLQSLTATGKEGRWGPAYKALIDFLVSQGPMALKSGTSEFNRLVGYTDQLAQGLRAEVRNTPIPEEE